MASAPNMPGNARTQSKSHPQHLAVLPTAPSRPAATSLRHIKSLIGEPSSQERRALRQIVQEADLIEVDGRYFLLAPISPDTVEILASFEAEHAEMEEDDEDRCDAKDDAGTDGKGFAPQEMERYPGDPDDAEDDNEDCCAAHDDDPHACLSDGSAGDPEDSHPEGGGTGFNPWRSHGGGGWDYLGYRDGNLETTA